MGNFLADSGSIAARYPPATVKAKKLLPANLHDYSLKLTVPACVYHWFSQLPLRVSRVVCSHLHSMTSTIHSILCERIHYPLPSQ
ncbi:hypothetical protein PoB_002370800 [Plakobranchus ocellatus]|uniref:Uncharacterized protein n=1 Tax=Plakobranchus ocellatus TaxID=259542 RepID=A0AAV3ZQU3_9GAST|nr:hypothetical protein PoB_002370800 [Plakobranchus ocellatus]